MSSARDGVVELVKKQGIPTERALLIIDEYTPLAERAVKLAESSVLVEVRGEDDAEGMAAARAARLELRQCRIEAERTRKKLKQESLDIGRVIDGIYNMIEQRVGPAEERCLMLEETKERAQAARDAQIRGARESALRELGVDVRLYNVVAMNEEQFQDLLERSRREQQQRLEEAEREVRERLKKEEEDRQERERLKAENDRLRKEAEERDAARRQQEAAAAAERARLEKEAQEAKQQAAKLEQEKREQEARLAKAARDQQKAERRAAQAPDADKLFALAKAIGSIGIPTMATANGKAALAAAQQEIRELINKIESDASRLRTGEES